MSKNFAANQIRLKALVDILASTSDPSTGGGLSASVASLCQAQIGGAGKLYFKTGSANTGWSQMTQSLAWFNVRDFGAVGDDSTDDRAAIQLAIAACEAFGGGVVYFPEGTYRVSQDAGNGYSFLLASQNFIQFLGAGGNSVVKMTGNAALGAWSMFKVTGTFSYIRFEDLRFDGSQVTNPSVNCHLLQIGNGVGTGKVIQIFACYFTGMVAGSGDAVLVQGANGAEISKVWVSECVFDGVGRYGIHATESTNNLFFTDNFLTNCLREIVVVAASDRNINAVTIIGNHCAHTGTDKLAIQIQGGTTTLISHMTLSSNSVMAGFVEVGHFKWTTMVGNVQSSGVYASGNAAWRIFGTTTDSVFYGNFIDRAVGSDPGVCLSLEPASGSSPSRINVRGNVLVQEVAACGFIQMTDITLTPCTGNMCRGGDAGSSTAYGIELDAVAVAVDNVTVSGNTITAASGSYAAGVRLFADGVDVINALVQGNVGAQMDYGLERTIAGGAAFSGKVMYAINNFDPTVGEANDVGGTFPALIVGGNGGTFGSQFFEGHGTPESVVTARAGSLYFNLDGGQGISTYYKETGTGTTGWLGIGGTGMVFGGGSMGAGAAAVYLGSGYLTAPTATEIQVPVTRPGTLRNLRVHGIGAGVGVATVTYTVRKNGVDTAITCTVANDAAAPWDASDVTHAVTVVAGDLISISCAKSVGVVSGQTNGIASLELA